MTNFTFQSALLERFVNEIDFYGYKVIGAQDGYDQNNNYVQVKTVFCERTGVQITFQVTKTSSIIDTNEFSRIVDDKPKEEIEGDQ